jgi:hypothetical protein
MGKETYPAFAMDEWLSEARDRLAAAAGEDPAGLELSQEEVDELLELARIAAHESGERINAPLLCYAQVFSFSALLSCTKTEGAICR